jgi:hypothetical protein
MRLSTKELCEAGSHSWDPATSTCSCNNQISCLEKCGHYWSVSTCSINVSPNDKLTCEIAATPGTWGQAIWSEHVNDKNVISDISWQAPQCSRSGIASRIQGGRAFLDTETTINCYDTFTNPSQLIPGDIGPMVFYNSGDGPFHGQPG